MYDEFKLDLKTDSIRLVSHNSVLNCLFILTNDSKLYLFDCNSRSKLKEINLTNKIDLNYNYFKILNIQDKCIIVSDRTICSRLANEGLFLLDTVLQSSVLNLSQTNTPELVFRTLELSLNDAINLLQSLKLIETESIQGLDVLVKQIEIQVDSLSKLDDTSWLTVQITENYFTLLTVLTQCLEEIKRTNIQSVSIPIISLLLDRLYRLDSNLIDKQIHGAGPNGPITGAQQAYNNFDKRYMCSEATRRATFNEWPHMDYKWVLPDALAQAGFYHQPTHPGDDRTICFVCDLCLVAWEQHDQPWSEHERHSPICQFVRGELTENVPLSLTAATQAANLVFKSNDPKDTVVCTSELSSERYFAVSNSSGHIIVYDSKDILKEMMHVQLINESQYNKEHKLKIHSLCFYYRNHKHVLYGSFTINDEVFIFSFNIFDIYRSYHSKSNKKSSKTHKTSSNSVPSKSSSSAQKAQTSKTLQATPLNAPPVIVSETKTMEAIMNNELKNNDLSQLVTQDITLFSEGAEFQKYMNNIIKIDSDLNAQKSEPEVTLQHQLSSENSTKNNSDDASDLKESKKLEEETKAKTETQLNTFLNNNKNYYDNMFSLILNSDGQKLNQNTNSFDLFTLPKTQPITLPKQLGTFQATLANQANPKTNQALNLSNFLNVRFEITPNNQQPPIEQSSKSKNKYKKTIKILTVSCRPLNALYSNESVPDIQLKSYEFTEKCLSFRLASIDLTSEPRTGYDIKLINLYEKYLCALVNFKTIQTGIESFKLFRIKHEETSSSSSASMANNVSTGSVSSIEPKPKAETNEPFSPSCLAATSSSRLNLTEFILTSIPSNNLNSKVVSIMPISVTTIEDDDSDLKFVAILDENGLISIIDPNKCCKVIEFNSPSSDDIFVQMIYCYGIDKICAITQNGKINMISTRVYPIVNQSLLDEMSDTLNLAEISLTKKLLVDAPIDSYNLSILHNLAIFDQSKTNFSAKLPACWSLVLSEHHQQRKHPQHILAESSNHTKCWKYLNNMVQPSQNSENLSIEIYLNKPIQIGCIQIKLKFNKELTFGYELSVFRQKRIDSTKSSVDSTIDFNLNQKQELIYGPIDIREFLDPAGTKTYLITLCSPKLYETRSNMFYLNLKSKSPIDIDSPNTDPKLVNQLQKIQITIRKYRRNGLQFESIERSLMLTKLNFFNSLLKYFFDSNSPDNQIKIIDILNWIFYNYLGNINSEYLNEILKKLKENLSKFLLNSYVYGTRSKARKATVLLTFLLSQTFDPDKKFARILLENLLKFMNYLSDFESSSSMNWFFVLFHQCMSLDVQSAHEKCLKLLNKLSSIQKYNPYYSLLKMRFNFSGLIFEPRLFDLDSCLKFDSVQLKPSVNSVPQQSQQISQTSSNPFTFSFGSVGLSINQQNQQVQPVLTNSSHNLIPLKESPSILSHTSGLIEVLPLSYKSISSSNGSTIEKNGQKQDNSLYILPDYFSIMTNPEHVQSQDPGLDTSILSSIFTLNPVQYMVIDRMEPMSKHFVVLDFGYPVCLSDVKIPACPELSSISVDIWLNKEQKDSKRLCLSTDINTQSIVLSDLQPAPVCRYLKLIFVAHSSNIVKARIPLGYYFGHPYIFSSEQALPDTGLPVKNVKQTMAYLSYLEKLYEDSKCHYSISVNKLKDLLNEIQFPTDNIGHLKMMQFSDSQNSEQVQKVKDQYNECLDYQFKLNLNSQLIKKLRFNLYSDLTPKDLSENITDMSEDHLRVTNLMLIKTLLCLSSEKTGIKLEKIDALNLFNSLCVNGNLDKECSWLLIRLCQNEDWWGEFIRECLKIYFVNQIKQPVHLSKVFVTLNEMCLKSLNGKQGQILFNSLFGLVKEILEPLNEDKPVEVTCLEWVLLFISRLLSVTTRGKEVNRWEFLENIYTNPKNSKTAPAVRQKTKIKKKLFQSNKYLTWNKIKETRKNLEKYRKHLWKSENFSQGSSTSDLSKNFKKLNLSRDLSLRVCKLFGKLLVGSNSYCSSDLFVLSCRIISSLCCNSQPSITLSEIFDQSDLNELILLNVSAEFNHGSVCWGSPWSQHALLSLFMDIIENEKIPESKEARPLNLEKSLKMIEEIDELNIEKKINPTSVADAVKLSSNLAKSFNQIADILTSHLSTETDEDKKSLEKDMSTEENLINNLVETAMNKKLEEIKNNIVAPFQQMNTLFGSTSSVSGFVNKKLNSSSLKTQVNNWTTKLNSEPKLCTDNRLDSSFYKTMEMYLNLKLNSQNETFQNSLNETSFNNAQAEPEVVELKLEPKSSVKILQDTLESLFDDLSVINIENLLTFWLTLSTPSSTTSDQTDSTLVPILTLKDSTCLNLLEYLNQFMYMTVKIWHLSFRILSVLVDSESKIAIILTQNDALYKFIYKFLNSSDDLVGDECCQSMVEFLKKLEKLSNAEQEKNFKIKLFELLNESMDYDHGCISRGKGPIDAQVIFVEYLASDDFLRCYELNTESIEFEVYLTKYFGLLSKLTQYHISTYPRVSVKGLTSPRSCFSGVLTSILFGTKEKFKFSDLPTSQFSPLNQNFKKESQICKKSTQSVQCSRDLLICLLLKFAVNFVVDAKMNVVIPEPIVEPETVEPPEEDVENFYEDDDLLLQQLFLYDLQQINGPEAENFDPESEFETDTEIPKASKLVSSKLNFAKNLTENNLKRKKLIRLISSECLEVYIESLALCQSSALAMVISNSGYPIELTLDDVQTPGDGLFLLLKSISANTPLKLVDPAFNYLKKIKRLSEPLLWLFSSLFQNESVIKAFIEKNGIEIISKGLNNTTKQLLYSGPCIVSSLMNLIDSERQQLKNSDNESTEGFTNFAPYGSIICTNPTGNPVDVLVQNSAPHRRIRSSIWSYHFQSEENKVGLFLSFPYAFLLKEVHILPHTVSFGNCPAYVSIEVSRDGSFMTPIGPPVYTMGMPCIKLQLNKSELVNTVQINLYKSKDSQMIGLSQIKLLGYPMFENMLSAKPDMMLTPVEDLVSRSNMGWLRLLYMCLTSVPQVESLVCEKIQDSTMLLCTRLLSSPAMIIYDKITETILLKLSKHNQLRSLEITKCLLRAEHGSNSGLYSVPHGVLMETLINILYQISENLSHALEIKHSEIIFNWLEETIKSRDRHPSSMLFHCVACIVYKSKQLPLISNDLIKNLIEYSCNINEFYTKQSINWLLCALFCKDATKLTIFMESLNKFNGQSECLIDTLSYVIQSDEVLELFLKCDYFEKFVEKFNSDVKNSSIGIGDIKILLSMAEYEKGQEWLGNDLGQSLWQGLIKLMSTSYKSLKNSEQIGSLCIKLVKKLIFLNENNQIKFSHFITQMIKEASSVEFYLEKNLNSNSFPTISGFLHQLILQVLLDDQTIIVNFNRKTPFKSSCNSSLGVLFHPKFSTGNCYKAIEMPLSKTCSSITNMLSDLPISLLNSKNSNTQTQEFTSSSTENFFEMKDFLTKLKTDKKETKLSEQAVSKIRLCANIDGICYFIPNEFSLEKVLNFYIFKSGGRNLTDLSLGVCFGDETGELIDEEAFGQFSTPLETFVNCNGLTVLAERLPILMPFIHEPLLSITDKDRAAGQQEQPKTSPDFVDYVIMNESDGPFVDEMYNEMPVTTTNTLTNQSNKLKKMTMPPHAFIAFGLFLKIPGYASVMMKNKKQAQCILKLLLGANRNKDEEFSLSLSTMPFSSLKDLLIESKYKNERFDLTNFISENRILTFILSILSNISHHPHRQKNPHFCQNLLGEANGAGEITNPGLTNEEKSNLYWAKGTGFGTGSTIQQWDAEKTLMQQKMEEEHVACILEILSSFIECCEEISDSILELIDHSCVINALSSYLRNDSVLDISRHIPLYKSALKLLQSLILSERLRALIEQCNIFELIKNMKQFVDSYTQRIRLSEEEGDFASLVPILNSTYDLVISYVKPVEETLTSPNEINLDDQDIDKIYCDCLKSLQFDTFSIVSETSNGLFKSNLPFFYENSLNDLSINLNNANRAKRLAQETVTLSNSLPLSFSSSVFVRCDEDRLDVMKVLITGPQDTPYANGCFEFDVFFPADYPDSPPMINLQTTGNQTVRFNPNLYHDGKVCLSILNTWHGRPEERWNGQTSSFLQVLVSIQSLILVSEPYFNEPGYERSRGTPAGTIASIEHDANIRQATVRWAMLEMIRKPSACFKDVIHKHFYFKKKEIKDQCEQWLRELESHVNDKQIGASMAKNAVALKRHMAQLFELLDQIKLEDTMEDAEGSNTTLEENQEVTEELKIED